MKPFRVLIIGDASHKYVKDFVVWLRNKWEGEIVIDILSISTTRPADIEKGLYDNIIDYNISDSVLLKIPKIREIVRFLWIYKKQYKKIQDHYDVCHIHYVYYYHLLGWDFIKKNSNKTILSIWGNDFNATFGIRKIMVKKLLQLCDYIALSNPTMTQKIIMENVNPNKIKSLGFGLAPLDELKMIENISKKNAKKEFGISEDNISISCGYSSRSEHRQIEIIEAIKKLPIQIINKIVLLLPMTYGNGVDNIKKVKSLLSESNLSYHIFEEYMSNKDVAYIRKASDIFIHIVDYDQNSGSMMEYFYAENIVITGDWLPFTHLEKQGIFFEKISRNELIEDKILLIIENKEVYAKKINNNKNIVEKTKSWSSIIDDWIELYKDI